MDELVFIAHGNNGIIQVINARNQKKNNRKLIIASGISVRAKIHLFNNC